MGGDRSVLFAEPRVGGRLFEAMGSGADERIVQTGAVLRGERPERLVLEWCGINFAPGERTQVDVSFEPAGPATLVTIEHSGWSHLRPDHPVRHGQPPSVFLRTLAPWWSDLATSLRLVAERSDA